MTSPRLAHSLDLRAGRAVALFGVVLLALLWVAIVVNLGFVRQRLVEDARVNTASLARVFDEHIQRTIAGLDQTLVYLRAEYRQDPQHFDLNRSIANNVILKRVSVQIARIGANGRLEDSNVPGFQRMDLSDREHFRVHRDGVDDMLFISKPVLGRASGKWSIQLTRRLDDTAGRFAGVLVISLDPYYLAQFYGSVDLGDHGAIALVGRDGILRATSQGDGRLLGHHLPEGPLMAAIRAGGAATLASPGPMDDVARVLSVRALPDLALAVVVGRSMEDVLEAYHDAVATHVAVGMAVTLVLGLAVLVLYRMVRNQEAIAQDLAVKKGELVASRIRLRRYVADLERIAEVAAHDLQEPLRRVVAYAQLLSSHVAQALDDEGRGYVAHVVDGAQRMRKLVQDLEAFVAVDQLPEPVVEIAAGGAVAEAMARLGDQIRSCGAVVVVEELPDVAADEKSLAEIFTQLLDNAMRFVAPGRRPQVRIEGRVEGGQSVFSVRDNGRGIAPRDRVRLFEVFHRLEEIDGGGTGIGLAIVRRMVERQCGRVWVETEPGEGSCFSFSLPRHAAQGLLQTREVRAA